MILDVDYRPNLWGLAGHGAGDSRYMRSSAVSARLASVLPECDLIVGTEEELHVADVSEDTLDAIRRIRAAAPGATIVCKRGAMGCVAFAPGAIPERLEDGVSGPGFPVEVYNTLGAGDAFLSGFLWGWLGDEPLATCCAWANACGALAVSRLLCSPEFPSFAELQRFVRDGSPHHAVRLDAELNHLHRATTRCSASQRVVALAVTTARSWRPWPTRPAHRASASRPSRSSPWARPCASLPDALATGCCSTAPTGRAALFRVASHPELWLARPVERPGSRPLDFETPSLLGAHLAEWPVWQIVKCLCFYHPDDPEELRVRQERELLRLNDACRRVGRGMVVEIIAGKHGMLGNDTVAHVVGRLYDLGIRLDWWKLETQPSPRAWANIGDIIRARDPHRHGIVMLGLDAPLDDLVRAFAAAAREQLVRGFAVGRTIFAEPAQA